MMKEKILSFWFGDVIKNPQNIKSLMGLWFGSSPETDALIIKDYKKTLDELSSSKDFFSLAEFSQPEGRLALIILFDQFTRNIYRNTASMFSNDALALSLTRYMIDKGEAANMHPLHQLFIYLVSCLAKVKSGI